MKSAEAQVFSGWNLKRLIEPEPLIYETQPSEPSGFSAIEHYAATNSKLKLLRHIGLTLIPKQVIVQGIREGTLKSPPEIHERLSCIKEELGGRPLPLSFNAVEQIGPMPVLIALIPDQAGREILSAERERATSLLGVKWHYDMVPHLTVAGGQRWKRTRQFTRYIRDEILPCDETLLEPCVLPTEVYLSGKNHYERTFIKNLGQASTSQSLG